MGSDRLQEGGLSGGVMLLDPSADLLHRPPGDPPAAVRHGDSLRNRRRPHLHFTYEASAQYIQWGLQRVSPSGGFNPKGI